MIEELAKEAGKSFWKDVGQDAVKKAVGTVVSEGIKAVIDIWKQRRLKLQAMELKEADKSESKSEDKLEEKEKEEESDESPDEEAVA